jgi:hypothetical protein
MSITRRVKLFEEFLTEEDPLAALGGLGGDDKKEPKEDPIAKIKKEIKAKDKDEVEKHEEYVDSVILKCEDDMKDAKSLDAEDREHIISTLKSQDRTRIHNLVNDIIEMQIKYQDRGNQPEVEALSKVKEEVEKLDKSFTEDKMM